MRGRSTARTLAGRDARMLQSFAVRFDAGILAMSRLSMICQRLVVGSAGDSRQQRRPHGPYATLLSTAIKEILATTVASDSYT